jgi:hypothetical protein
MALFRLASDGKTVEMVQGNTGTLRFVLTGYTFGNNDRVKFTMRSKGGTIVKNVICEVVDGAIEVPFANSDTDCLQPGKYRYAITAATDPVYDQGGDVTGGSGVCTPEEMRDNTIVVYDTSAVI